jgi:hypothetical protein
MDLQFINVSDPQQIKSSQARHLVRSQAMRSYHHRQREHVTSHKVAKQPHRKLSAASPFSAGSSTSSRDLTEQEAEEDVPGQQTQFSAIIKATKGNKLGICPHPLSQAFVYRVLDYCTRYLAPRNCIFASSLTVCPSCRCSRYRMGFRPNRQVDHIKPLREKYPSYGGSRCGFVSCNPC